MFLFFVCLVSMNLFMIRTEEVIVRIIKTDQQGVCEVPREVTLHEGKHFTLQVHSAYFIKESSWIRKDSDQHLQELENSKFSITYERTKNSGKSNNTFVYTYSHTGTADHKSGGTWNFTFELLTNYDPWSRPQQEVVQSSSCSTHVQIVHSKPQEQQITTSESPGAARSTSDVDTKWLIPLVTVLGILLCVQTSFMVFGRVRGCKSNRNNDEDPLSPKSPKTKRGCKTRRTIADRPPLPLPLNEVVKQEPKPPVSPVTPMSPVAKHHLFPSPSAPPIAVQNSYKSPPGGPIVPKQSYTKKAVVNSDEELRSSDIPRRHEGPLVPKKSCRNKTLDISEEEPRTPILIRKQLEAKLAQLPPKGVAASKSFKFPKPSPRSPPSPPPEEAPAFDPAHRTGPAPPLYPKNFQVFPSPAPCQPRSIINPDSRLSDVDWQYEKLQPTSKYLDNFNETPYNNL